METWLVAVMVAALVAAGAVPASANLAAAEQLVYVDTADGDGEIYIANADGTSPRKLTSNAFGDCDPELSPDGSQIVWISTSASGDKSEVFVMDADGSDQTQLTSDPVEFTRNASFTPDGNGIVFQRTSGYVEGTESWTSDIHIIRRDPSTGAWGPETKLTSFPGRELTPQVSHDGESLAYTYDADNGGKGASEVWASNLDGTGARRLSALLGASSPAWSPDDSKIAFGRTYIFTVNPDGTGETKVSQAIMLRPAWSEVQPNTIYAESHNKGWNIYKFAIGSRKLTQVTFGTANEWGANL